MNDLTAKEREILRHFAEMLAYINSPYDFEQVCAYANKFRTNNG